MENMETSVMWPRSLKGTVLELSIRELILVGATVLVSVLYKLIINLMLRAALKTGIVNFNEVYL